MAIDDLTTAQTQQLWNARDALTGLRFIEQGEQPWDGAANNAWRHLAIASFGALQVRKDDESDTHVRVMPGRAIVDDQTISYAGGTIDLAAHNGETALVALKLDGSNDPEIVTDTSWPAAGTPHIKLAEVVVADDAIDEAGGAITDRRAEHVFRQGTAVDDIADPGTASAEDAANKINELLGVLRTVGLVAESS